MSLLLLDDQEIDQRGIVLEEQIGDLLSECMSAAPFFLKWPKRISDVASDAALGASAQGTWRKMRQLSAKLGGGSLIWYDTFLNLPVGYAHCVELNEQIIADFRLADSVLSDQAKPGELLLTFAGLENHYRGVRVLDPSLLVLENEHLIYPPLDGWEASDARPGVGLYSVLYSTRLERWGVGRKVWNRTHPDCAAVLRTANKFGLNIRGQFEVSQGGSMTPKVVLSTDGSYAPVSELVITSATSSAGGAE